MTMTSEPVTQTVPGIPEGFATVTPSMVIEGAAEAIEFYAKAFGAKEIDRASTPDGKIMHATIQIGNSRLMINDAFPDWQVFGPKKIGGTPVTVHLYVEDADAVFDQAVAAGATVMMPMNDAFWGDRYGHVVDPFGHSWSIATHKRDATEAEIESALRQMQDGCPANVTE
jgi:PhnB protein